MSIVRSKGVKEQSSMLFVVDLFAAGGIAFHEILDILLLMVDPG